MGSQPFYQHYPCDVARTSALQAFVMAVAVAEHDHGHSGYSGTLAEKEDFVMIEPHSRMSPEEYAAELVEDDDERIDDKWGPAGCILTPTGYLFFGWASS